MTGYPRQTVQFEALWWSGPEMESDRYRNFGSLDEAMAWLRGQDGLSEWIVRRRSVDGWRAVASGTKADLG